MNEIGKYVWISDDEYEFLPGKIVEFHGDKYKIEIKLNVGPVVVGTNWYYGMFYPDTTGLIKIRGGLAGGHAYVINGVDTGLLYASLSSSLFLKSSKSSLSFPICEIKSLSSTVSANDPALSSNE